MAKLVLILTNVWKFPALVHSTAQTHPEATTANVTTVTTNDNWTSTPASEKIMKLPG